MKPRVLLDADGVMFDFVGPYLDAVEVETDTRFTREQVTGWDVAFSLKLTQEEIDDIDTHHVLKHGFCYSLPVLPGAQEGFALLSEVADVFIVTSPYEKSEYWMKERERALKRHFNVSAKRILHASSKNLVFGRLFVDDKHSNVAGWALEWGHHGGVGVLWNTPHNQLDSWHLRTSSWKQLVSWVEGGL